MFYNISRKIMGPVIFRDEVEVGNRSGVEGSKNGIFSRVTDRCGGEPNKEVSVIGSGLQQMFFRQVSIKIFNSIDHGGVTLKRDLLF